MNFQYPYLLLLIFPVIATWWLLAKRRASISELRRFPFLLCSMIFLLIALANPYWSTQQEMRTEKGADLILMIDVSQSMFCPDGAPTRIEQARIFLRSILPRFGGSPIAVIYFAGDAQIGSPLTTDLPAIHLFLDSIVPAMTARPGTRVATLKTVVQDVVEDIARRQASRKQIGLLFSDGEFFDSDRSFRSWLSKQNDLTLFAFECGKAKSPVPKYDLSGPYPGAISNPDPIVLKHLAESTGGISYNLSNASPSIVTEEMSRHVTEMIAKGKIVPRYRSYPFLLLSFLFLFLYQLLPTFTLSWSRSRFARAAVVSLLLIFTVGAARIEPKADEFSKAIEDIKKGRVEQGIQKLKKLQSLKASEEVEIALGNAMLQKNQPDEAIRYYKNALRMNPFNERARWNWEVALKGESEPPKPPPQQPPPPPTFNPPPPESQALLNYFNQLEKEDRKQENLKNANEDTFAW